MHMGYIVQLLETTVVTTNTALSKQNEARELEYHVGGRLNHMTFVLLKKKEGEPAEGAVVVSRYKPQHQRLLPTWLDPPRFDSLLSAGFPSVKRRSVCTDGTHAEC